jgi:SAM-dependent methyltransferase
MHPRGASVAAMPARDLSRAPPDELRQRLREETDAGAPWSRQTYLRDGVFTIGEAPLATDFRLRWLLQLASDLARGRLDRLRVLDLGCEEGHFGLEFARHGADVVAVDVRPEHLRRARFMAEAVGARRFETRLADVRELEPVALGEFDLVLCLGLHYHLDTPDLFRLFETLAAVCRWALVLYGQFSLADREAREHRGRPYHGRAVFEHAAQTPVAERRRLGLASPDNPESFWLTKPSLINLLTESGFSSVCEQLAPRGAVGYADRTTLLALKGPEPEVYAMPGARGAPRPRWPQRERLERTPEYTLRARLRAKLLRTRPVGRLGSPD